MSHAVCLTHTFSPLSPHPQKSSITGVPFLSLQGELHLNPRQDPHQNEALVQMWSEIKLKPLLKSINKHFLSCLSTRNFSCSTYQIVYVWVFACVFLSPLCHNFLASRLFLQGERAQSTFLWDEWSQKKLDLRILYVPFSVWRQSRR